MNATTIKTYAIGRRKDGGGMNTLNLDEHDAGRLAVMLDDVYRDLTAAWWLAGCEPETAREYIDCAQSHLLALADALGLLGLVEANERSYRCQP